MSSGLVGSPARRRRVGRSVLALLAGIAVGIVLSVATDFVLHKTGFYPPLGHPTPSPQLAVATAYRAIYGILSAYIIAWLAPYQPMGHALLAGALGTMVSLGGAISMWNMNLGAHWYPLALVVIALPTAWIGGRLRLMQLRNDRV
jgi:hypothetical protein